MNYAKIIPYDTGNWDGITTTIFFSGCTLNCLGCFNKELHDFNYGQKYTLDVEEQLIKYASSPHVTGVCIMGGEVFQQDLDILQRLTLRLRIEVDKPIHIWSGYTFEELMKKPDNIMVLLNVDTLVDGRFVLAKKDLTLKYRGSSNQRVIDVQASLKEGRAVQIIN